QVYASIDAGDWVSLPATVVSPQQAKARLSRDQWSDRQLVVDLTVETSYGLRQNFRRLPRVTPKMTFRNTGTDYLIDVEPSRFYANQRYLLKEDGTATGDAFKSNPQGFFLCVEDLGQPDLNDASKASVNLRSEDGQGGILDRITGVQMTGTGKPGEWTLGDRQIVAVMDAVDDGAVASDTGKRFSPDDNQSKDPTIQARVDEKITAVYGNQAKQIKIERNVYVCPVPLKRRVYLHLVNLDGSGFTDQEIVDNLLARARDVWAQACVDLVVVPEPDGSLVRHVANPTADML